MGRPVAVGLALLCLGALGCQTVVESPAPAEPAPVTRIVVPVATAAPPSSFATATPWPTFTPMPTWEPVVLPTGVAVVFPPEEPAMTPSPAEFPTLAPTPTVAVLPTVDATGLDTEEFVATPTPEPFQLRIPDTDVKVVRQTVFMSHYPEGPDFWPPPSSVFYARTARFIGWRVMLDYADAPDGFEMQGLMRWLNVSTGEHVIYQEPYQMVKGQDLIFMMGKPVPGFWTPGRYRLELWDNRDRVAVYYDFQVRSGVTQ